jgi:hypothetical protein
MEIEGGKDANVDLGLPDFFFRAFIEYFAKMRRCSELAQGNVPSKSPQQHQISPIPAKRAGEGSKFRHAVQRRTVALEHRTRPLLVDNALNDRLVVCQDVPTAPHGLKVKTIGTLIAGALLDGYGVLGRTPFDLAQTNNEARRLRLSGPRGRCGCHGF